MSKLMWYLQLWLYFLTVWFETLTTDRKGGSSYWWGIAREVHEDRWGKI